MESGTKLKKVEATRWFKNGDHPEDSCEMFDAGDGPFQGEGNVVRYYRHPCFNGKAQCPFCDDIMHNHGWIDAGKEGHVVCPGDWIITNNQIEEGYGHYFPLKPDIFSFMFE